MSALVSAAPETFGKGVSLTTVTPLDQMLKQPAQFEGRTVRVEGVVTAVCLEMGCWMALGAKDAPGVPTMMIKVDDKEGNEAVREKANAEKTVKPASTDSWLIKAARWCTRNQQLGIRN